jgi:hypothetical protein
LLRKFSIFLFFPEVYVVAPREYESKLSHFLGEYVREAMNIDLVVVDDIIGSADCLRAVSDRIRGDFFCLGSDFISQFCLGELANMHRLRSSDLTMLLTSGSKEVKRDEMDEEFIGICDDGRVMLKIPLLEVDETLELSKPLLRHAPSLSLRQDLQDLGVYLMSHWVLEFLMADTKMSSIRTDLVPFLINRQFQSAEYMLGIMPALEHRNRPLKAVEPWIMGCTAGESVSRVDQMNSAYGGFNEDKGQAILDLMEAEGGQNEPSTPMHRYSPVPNTHFFGATAGSSVGVSASAAQAAAGVAAATASVGGSATGAGVGAAGAGAGSSVTPMKTSASSRAAAKALERCTDLLRCFALVYEPPARLETAAAPGGNITILSRIVNIPLYLNLNK